MNRSTRPLVASIVPVVCRDLDVAGRLQLFEQVLVILCLSLEQGQDRLSNFRVG